MASPKNYQRVEKKATIGRVEAERLMKNSKGRFMTAEFINKEGEVRVMSCRTGVTKGLVKESNRKREAVDVSGLGLMRVWDVPKGAYRTVNLQTLQSLKLNGIRYTVK